MRLVNRECERGMNIRGLGAWALDGATGLFWHFKDFITFLIILVVVMGLGLIIVFS